MRASVERCSGRADWRNRLRPSAPPHTVCRITQMKVLVHLLHDLQSWILQCPRFASGYGKKGQVQATQEKANRKRASKAEVTPAKCGRGRGRGHGRRRGGRGGRSRGRTQHGDSSEEEEAAAGSDVEAPCREQNQQPAEDSEDSDDSDE